MRDNRQSPDNKRIEVQNETPHIKVRKSNLCWEQGCIVQEQGCKFNCKIKKSKKVKKNMNYWDHMYSSNNHPFNI